MLQCVSEPDRVWSDHMWTSIPDSASRQGRCHPQHVALVVRDTGRHPPTDGTAACENPAHARRAKMGTNRVYTLADV